MKAGVFKQGRAKTEEEKSALLSLVRDVDPLSFFFLARHILSSAPITRKCDAIRYAPTKLPCNIAYYLIAVFYARFAKVSSMIGILSEQEPYHNNRDLAGKLFQS